MWEGFWPMLGIVLPVLIVQYFQYKQSERNNKQSSEDRKKLKAQICEVKDHLDTVGIKAVRSQNEVDMAHRAGQRAGYVDGIEIGKQQATGHGPLER